MFRSVETGSRREHILLRKTRAEAEALRELALHNGLVCPECEYPVRVKAGEIKRWHFAHAVRRDCPLQNQSAILLQARALLYEWLETKFPGKVSIEVKAEGVALPRPIDCVVNSDKGPAIGFWIVEKPIRNPDVRQAILSGLHNARMIPRWIFMGGMLRSDEEGFTQVTLSTTERELITHSGYDSLYHTYGQTEGSLHYLDAETAELTTYRSLRGLHGEHRFLGHMLRDPLDTMLITAHGELVHPGEYERKQEQNEKKRAIRESCTLPDYWSAKATMPIAAERPTDTHGGEDDSVSFLEKMLFVCTACGRKIGLRDISQADCEKQTCLCRACAGLSK